MLALVMGEKRSEETVQLNIRVPRGMVDALDAVVAKRNEARGWSRPVSRNEVIREALERIISEPDPPRAKRQR